MCTSSVNAPMHACMHACMHAGWQCIQQIHRSVTSFHVTLFAVSFQVILFLGLLVLVYGLCFLLTISIESPTIALEKVFFPNLRSRSQEERDKDVTPDTVSC